jgi:hypothetical protein
VLFEARDLRNDWLQPLLFVKREQRPQVGNEASGLVTSLCAQEHANDRAILQQGQIRRDAWNLAGGESYDE